MRMVLVGCTIVGLVGCSKSETASPLSPNVAAEPAPSAPSAAIQKVAFQQETPPSTPTPAPAVPAPPVLPAPNVNPPVNSPIAKAAATQTPATNAPTHSLWDTLGKVAGQLENRNATGSTSGTAPA